MPGRPTGELWKQARSCCKLSQENHIGTVFLDTKLKSWSFFKRRKIYRHSNGTKSYSSSRLIGTRVESWWLKGRVDWSLVQIIFNKEENNITYFKLLEKIIAHVSAHLKESLVLRSMAIHILFQIKLAMEKAIIQY